MLVPIVCFNTLTELDAVCISAAVGYMPYFEIVHILVIPYYCCMILRNPYVVLLTLSYI